MSRWGTAATGPAPGIGAASRTWLVPIAIVAVLLFALLGSVGALLSEGQRETRQSAERRFAERAEISAALTQSVFGALGASSDKELQRRFGGTSAGVERRLGVQLRPSRLRYVAVVDARGRVLASAGDVPQRLALPRAAAGGPPLSDVQGRGRARVIEYGIPFGPPGRRRALVEGIPLAIMASFLDEYLARLRQVDGAGLALTDRRGTVITRKGRISPPGRTAPARLATAAGVPGTSWTLRLEADRDRVLATSRLNWLPWLLLGALALAACVGVGLYVRTLTSVRRQREANLALQESRDQIRSIVDALDTGVLLHHDDGRTELLNAAARRLVGSGADVIHDLGPGLKRLDADGTPLGDAERPADRVLRTGQPCDQVVGFQRPDGSRRWLSISVRPLVRPGAGRPHAVVAASRDVTEQRETELHLTELAQRDPLTGVWNRRRFEDDLAQQLARCRRYEERAALLVLDLDGFKQLNDTLGHLAGDEVLCALADGLSQRLRASDSVARIGGDEFALLLLNVDAVEAREKAIEVTARLDEFVQAQFGARMELSVSVGVALLDGKSGGVAEAFAAADQAMYGDKRRARRPAPEARRPQRAMVAADAATLDRTGPYLSSVRALLTAVQARDSYTAAHSRHVVTLARRVARRLGVDEETMRDVESVALMHDLGKIAVPDSILRKQGPLTAQEWIVMRQHPVVGAQIVASIPELAHLEPAVRAEHERWDGGGYPDGLAGEEIPLASRIAFVCDAHHAMTSDRPYRRALPTDEATEEIAREAGRQFCPASAGALLEGLRADAAERDVAGGSPSPPAAGSATSERDTMPAGSPAGAPRVIGAQSP